MTTSKRQMQQQISQLASALKEAEADLENHIKRDGSEVLAEHYRKTIGSISGEIIGIVKKMYANGG